MLARQRTRMVAERLGFDGHDQTRLATAVSEIARNAVQYAGGGAVEFEVEGRTAPQILQIDVSDSGPGIANLDEVVRGRHNPTGRRPASSAPGAWSTSSTIAATALWRRTGRPEEAAAARRAARDRRGGARHCRRRGALGP